jgi:hypothetical protein
VVDAETATEVATQTQTKHGMSNQQILGVGLMVWGVLGAVGFGAKTVHLFAQQVKAQRRVAAPGLVQPMGSLLLMNSGELKTLLREGNLSKIHDWVERNSGEIKVGEKRALLGYVEQCTDNFASSMTPEEKARLDSIHQVTEPKVGDGFSESERATFKETYNNTKARLDAVNPRPAPAPKKLSIKEAVTKTFQTGNLKQIKAGFLITLLGGATAALGGVVYATGGMHLEGDTQDPLAIYINTLGDIAAQLQSMPH